MTRMQRKYMSVTCLSLSALVAAACARTTEEPRQEASDEVRHVNSETASYTELNPGASMAAVWGDANAGAHGSFVKMIPGFTAPLHTHTNDLRIVVIRGAYLYRPENGPEQRIAAGHYLSVPGGDRHATGADATEGALFYSESTGRFDLNPVQ